MRKFLHDPLCHFLILGLALFGLFWLVNPEAREGVDDPKTVVVDRPALLKFLQFRMKAFEPKVAEAKFKALKPDQRQKLIDEYIREEVLYREAKAFGLDANDYIIRQRLVQKLSFMARGFAEADQKVTEEDAKAYYEKHLNRYEVQPEITFTHVFFSNRKHGKEGALESAVRAVEMLNAQSVPFSNASRFGERFPYNLNYVERTLSYVMSHFGEKAAAAIFALEPSEAIWYGPFSSEFGAHAVMVIKRQDGRVLDFDEVRPQVIDALKQDQVREKTEMAVNEVVKSYTIQIAPDIAALGEKAMQ